MQLRGDQVEQADAVEFAETSFPLGHPALRLSRSGGEVSSWHAETEPGTTNAAADLFGSFRHQCAVSAVRSPARIARIARAAHGPVGAGRWGGRRMVRSASAGGVDRCRGDGPRHVITAGVSPLGSSTMSDAVVRHGS